MAAATTPIFIETVKTPSARPATANTNRDGATGTYATIYTAGADGCFFKGFRWISEEDATANNVVRLFRQDAGSGNIELLYEVIVPAVTFSVGITPTAQGEWFPAGGIAGSGGTVFKVSIGATDTFGCFLEGGGDY